MSKLTSFDGDPDSAWPRFKHDHEVGNRPFDCQHCGSPRIFRAGNDRICASCGYEQEATAKCLRCHQELNARSRDMNMGLCLRCRNLIEKDAEDGSVRGPS